MPRTGDKVMVTFLVATIYWGIGDSSAPEDVAAAAAVLFLWSMLTAFTRRGSWGKGDGRVCMCCLCW